MTGARERLADVVSGWPIDSGYYQTRIGTDDARELVDALLPVVERIADERAADVLEQAADDDEALGGQFLRDRAASLRAAGSREETTR